MGVRVIEYEFEAKTDVWTGGVNGKNGKLVTTGLLGSIRWWFEVLVRGLGGSACDPTKTKCEGRKHCPVCELFGCTGWARKFRFEVRNDNGEIKTNLIKRKQTFRLRFTPLRPIRIEERTLLDATLRLIAKYGAIGGKTVFKPTDELALANVPLTDIEGCKVNSITRGTPFKRGDKIIEIDGTKPVDLMKFLAEKAVGLPLKIKIKREAKEKIIDGWVGKIHHQDYGIVEIESSPNLNRKIQSELESYVSESKWRNINHGEFAWASLQHFWCVNGKYLGRQDSDNSTFNQVIGRNKAKNRGQHLANCNDGAAKWLAGSQRESKKVFSFKNPPRTFGFVKPGLIGFSGMKTLLRKAWPDFQDDDFHKGPAILDDLLPKEDRS